MVINTCQDCHLESDEGAGLEMAGMINALSGLNDSLQFLLSSQPSCLHGPQQNWFFVASQSLVTRPGISPILTDQFR